MRDFKYLRTSRRDRAGFSLAELLISIVLIGIIGAAVTRLLLGESRLFNIQKARREARAVSRTSTNVLFSDLRMVNHGGSAPGSVLIASPDTLKVRVPYAFGIVCAVGSVTTVSMLAADSMIRASASYAGYAWRNRTSSRYTYTPVGGLSGPTTAADPSLCASNATVRVDTVNSRTWQPVDLAPAAAGAQPGAPVFLYQEVMYWFAPSAAYPQAGRMGLWRQATGGNPEELVAPFDASSGFKFYRRGVDTADVVTASAASTPPLDSIMGVAIALNGASPTTTITKAPVKTKVSTSVFFRNRRTN